MCYALSTTNRRSKVSNLLFVPDAMSFLIVNGISTNHSAGVITNSDGLVFKERKIACVSLLLLSGML